MESNDPRKIDKVLDLVLNYAFEGSGPFKGARVLAEEYINDEGFVSNDRRVSTLIKREVSKSFGSGFITGLGSGMTLPLSIPASLFSSLTGEARLAAAIALIYGHSLDSDHVRSMVVLSLAGEGFKDVLKSSGVDLANKAASRALKGLSAGLMNEIARRAGFAALKRLTGSSGINLTRVVPLAGGLAGGIIDAISAAAAGRAARKIFRKRGEEMGEKIELSIPVSRVSEYIRGKTGSIKNFELIDNNEFSLSVKRLPFRIRFRFEEYTDGLLRLSLSGGFIRKKIISKLLKRSLGRSSDEIRRNIDPGGDYIRINLNRLIAELMNELPVSEISSISISGRNIIAEID
jgi:hypothetical protein